MQIAEVLRLRGGNSPREGIVEMLWEEKWTLLSNYNWNRKSADVACRQLGYREGADEVVTTSRYVPYV